MRTTLRILFSLFLLLVVVSLVASLARNRVARSYAERIIAEQTGLHTDLQGISVGILSPHVKVQGLTLTNPPGYPVNEALSVEEVTLRYNRRSLFTDTVILPELSVSLNHLVMVRNEAGQSNLDQVVGDSFDGIWPRRDGRREPSDTPPPPAPAPKPPQAERPDKDVAIGKLTVKIGEVRMIDHYRRGDKPMLVIVPLNYERTFTNVTNLNALGQQIGMDIGLRAAPYLLGQLDQILDFDRESQRENLRELEGKVKDLLQGLRR
jgi:uncharacterized protein involved in outer membrane biogenesis